MSKPVRLFVTMIGSLIVTMFLFRHTYRDLSEWIPVALMMTVVCLPFFVPSVRDFIAARPRTVFWCGIAVITTAIGLIAALIYWSSIHDFPKAVTGDDPASLSIIYTFVVGVALTVVPRGILALRRLEPQLTKPKTELADKPKIGGMGEGVRALVTPIYRIVPFLRLAGIWIIVVWSLPLLVLLLASERTGYSIDILARSTDKNIAGLYIAATRFPFMLASLIAFPTVLVAWHRYLLEGYKPRFIMPLPNWRTMRYLLRLWMIFIVFSILIRMAFTNGPDLAKLIGGKDELSVSEILFWLILLIGIDIGSKYALVFPAIANGDRQFVALDSLVIVRRNSLSYRLGFVVSLLPLALVCWGIFAMSDVIQAWESWPLSYGLGAIEIMLFYLAAAACATYLSRVYEQALAKPADRAEAVVPLPAAEVQKSLLT